jgi:hypothetical protein
LSKLPPKPLSVFKFLDMDSALKKLILMLREYLMGLPHRPLVKFPARKSVMFGKGVGLIFAVFLFFVFVAAVSAQNPFEIEFPIPELGNCGSVDECKAYCDIPENIDACMAWAESQGIVPHDKPEKREEGKPEKGRVEALLEETTGPGGCDSPAACDAYCREPSHQEECYEFAVEHNLLSPAEIERIEKERAKAGPGGCRSRDECEAYCQRPENLNECLDFAVREGRMSAEEAKRIKSRAIIKPDFGPPRGPRVRGPEPARIDEEKARQILEEIGGPGGCDSLQACDEFCSEPANGEICFNFAVEHGLIPPEEAERMREMMEMEGPGGCRGRECELYCEQPGHEEECLNFAIENGLIPPEEVEQARRFVEASKEGGPGGCRGRECERYCADPAHRDECFAFAKENELIPPEELEKIEKLENKMREGGGPGGCSNETECQEYCTDPSHFDECAAFAVDTGLMSPEEAKAKLKEFINIEHRLPMGDFGPPPGFGPPGGPDGKFSPPPGFGPPGVGPPRGPDGEFGPPPEGFGPPPGFEEEFERRFKQFERYREQFEKGEMPFGPPGGFPGGPPDSFPGMGPQHEFSGIRIVEDRSGSYTLSIKDPDGIQKFALDPAQGSRYSGELNGCPTSYESKNVSIQGFPVEASYVDCADNTVERTITEDEVRGRPEQRDEEMRPPEFPPQGEFPQGEGTFQGFPPGFPPPDEFPGAPGEFPGGPDGFPPPDKFPQPPEGFGPPPGFKDKDKFFKREFERRMKGEFEREFQEEYEQRTEQIEKQFEQEGFVPPPEGFEHPEGVPEDFPPPEEFPSQFPPQFQPPDSFHEQLPEGFIPTEEGIPPEQFPTIPPEDFSEPEEFTQPPDDFMPPPTDFVPPEGFVPPPDFTEPPPQDISPPPPEEPQAKATLPRIIANVIDALLDIFR